MNFNIPICIWFLVTHLPLPQAGEGGPEHPHCTNLTYDLFLPYHLGPNHICEIVSHIRDTIMSV